MQRSGLVARALDRLVEQRLVGDDAVHLDAAGAADDDLGLGVVDPGRELVRREAAEYHGVNGADAGAAQHGDCGLRDHGQVEDHAVPRTHAAGAERAGEARGEALQLCIGEALHSAGDGAVVDQRRLLAAARVHVAIQGVVAGIDLGAHEPAEEGRARIVQDPVPALLPVDALGGLGPEGLGVCRASGHRSRRSGSSWGGSRSVAVAPILARAHGPGKRLCRLAAVSDCAALEAADHRALRR